jgi:molybdopterin converting factor subunit 1
VGSVDFASHLFLNEMRLNVLFFGLLKDVRKTASEHLTIADGSTVASVLAHYQTYFDEPTLRSIAVAVNQQYVKADHPLADGDEVALLPPVSGGSQSIVSNGFEQRVQLIRLPIDAERVVAAIKAGEDGAVVVFDGIVRNNTRGRATQYLEYEAYEDMAVAQMQQLAARARDLYPVRDIALIHRLGHLEVGETSVLVVVASAHRAAAFDACRWLIDTLKREVPIWKKEVFADGAVWAAGEPFPENIAAHQS